MKDIDHKWYTWYQQGRVKQDSPQQNGQHCQQPAPQENNKQQQKNDDPGEYDYHMK
jgi:hypothetical protein